MLLQTPEFQKRIRETVLRAALVAPGTPPTETEDGPIPAKAVIQSVSFLGTNPEARCELDLFREHLAHYSYTEIPSDLKEILGAPEPPLVYPEINWIPYVALPESTDHPIQREIAAGYSVLKAETSDLIEYLREANTAGLPQREEKLDRTRRQYPVAAVAVHIPWGPEKKTENIPAPEELASLMGGLTENYRGGAAVAISGPTKSVESYTARVLSQKAIKDRTKATLATVDVGEGYIVCDGETEGDRKLDQFLSFLKIKREADRLEKASAYCREHLPRYVADKVAQESAWEAMRLTSGAGAGPTGEARDQIHKTFDDLRCRNQDWDSALAEIRRSTLGIASRDGAIAQERAADQALGKLARASLRREKALKLDTPKGEFPTREALKETAEAVTKDFLEVIAAYEALQKTILESPHGCRFEPWSTRIFLIRSTSGFQGNHAGEAFLRKTERWGEKELKELMAHCRENKCQETALGFHGGYGVTIYPSSPCEPILNPGGFPKIPEGLLPALDPTAPIAKPKVRLDIRLQPRSDIWTEALLDLDNLLVEAYNPVAGKPMGFKDAALWRPVITRRGIPQTAEALESLGYELDCSAQTHNFVERKVRKAEKILAPNYPLTPYEAMAYFENGPRRAEKTVVHPDTGDTLWVEGKTYHITPSWRRQTMLVDHSVEDSEETSESTEATAPEGAPETARESGPTAAAVEAAGAEDIVVLGNNSNAERIQGGARISTLTERRINFGYSTFIVEAEGGKTYEIRETVTKDTIGMEKERIAIEIEHLSERLAALEAKKEGDLKKQDKAEMAKLRKGIEEKARELDEWAPMLEDFLEAFPPEAPPLASEVYGEQIAAASKAIYRRFGPYIKTEESGQESSIKDYQLKWAAMGAIKRGHLDGSNPGAGKAQPLDAKVLTTRGWIRMGDISLEDQVLTPEGGRADVLGIFPQGKIPIFKITLADGRSTEACAQHLWKTTGESGEEIRNTEFLRHLLNKGTRVWLPLAKELALGDRAGREAALKNKTAEPKGVFAAETKEGAEEFAELIRSTGGSARMGKGNLVEFDREQTRIEITSIEPCGKKDAQCILIDHPDHLYVTDDYIVTHNTLMAIMSSWRMGHHYNWIICPTIAMKTWAAELDRVGLYHEMVGYKKEKDGAYKPAEGPYEHMRRLTARFHGRIRTPNRLGKIEPEYYIVSAEAVCLGGEGNKTYSPWHSDHIVLPNKMASLKAKLESGELGIPPHWEIRPTENNRWAIRVWSDRPDNAKEIKAHGFDDFIKPTRFSRVTKRCPKCEAEAPTWTKHGHCGGCGHHHSAITRVPQGWEPSGKIRLACQKQNLTANPKEGSRWQGTKTSLRQYPLYKMMGKHVGCKIIDEIHNWSNFHSQHGAALLQVRCKDAIVLSGTLCKTHIAELEPSLCQVYEPNSGEFPYAPWGMGLFKEQFQTMEMESTYRSRFGPNGEQTRRRTTEKVVPEASNLTKLRALLHGVMCAVGETEMERVWNLKPIRESIRYVELQPRNAAIYAEWERLLQSAYEECKTEVERIGMLRRARSQMTHLAYACDGPEKLEAAIAWVQERIAAGQRAVVVGPSTRFYTMLAKALREREIPFMAMGNTAPEKRYEILNKFRDSNCPVFLSRIRLVNVNFNQLTCCTHILFTGIDPSPAALRQMQKRLNRIGQTQDVHCTFLISQMPRRQPIAQEIENTLAALETGMETEAEDTVDVRPPSYEERLFALVLRRETAIKQTLQQADRQRDPQELYEMLRDRQTLNQLLEDIVTNAKTDAVAAEKMRSMVETPEEKPTLKAEAPLEVETRLPGEAEGLDLAAARTGENLDLAAARTVEQTEPDTAEETTAPRTSGRGRKGGRKTGAEAQPRFTWAPVRRNRPNILQGELFAL